ncbi:MAG: cation-translocating P-type ATPase C-terminal domain-containing protein, partial [Candidatus Pacearchaeota archaeon]|nr:cation-translocating P-type ATPase C-terminal domain-containing protein [Candidatus Pacearchaeota archaeon]
MYLINVFDGSSMQKAQTMVLTTAVLFELIFVYTCRSDKPLYKIGFFSNKWLNFSVLFSLTLHLILIYSPLNNAFGVVALGIKDWFMILPFAFVGLIVFEGWKIVRNNINK